jgi:hypothetical protein
MKWLTLAVLAIPMMGADSASVRVVRSVRCSVTEQATIIGIEVSRDFEYTTGRLHDPERAYIDILGAKPGIDSHASHARDFHSPLLKGVRVGERAPNTRIVLDLAKPVHLSVSKSSSPARLTITLEPSEPGGSSAAGGVEQNSSVRAVGEQPQKVVAQTAPTELGHHSPIAVSEKPALLLSVSPSSLERGGTALMVVSLQSAERDTVVALQWQLSYPSPQAGIDSQEMKAGEAALRAGKTLKCAGTADGPGAYDYACLVAGGAKPISGNPISAIPVHIRSTARPGTIKIVLTGAKAVDANGGLIELTGSEATLTIE